MRKQYHFKRSKNGFFAWDVGKLIDASQDFPVFDIALSEIREFESNYWYQHEKDFPTCKSLTEHFKLIRECNLDFPIILASDGSVMDGMHRVCKAYLNGNRTISAVQFAKTPIPDFKDVFPEDLPY